MTDARTRFEDAARTYDILATHRRAPRSAASSLIMLVAPDADALCAARMLADLLKQDDIMHRIIPVSGMNELERIRDDLVATAELRTLIMLNMGAILDLPSREWFGDFPDHLRVHIIDANRPQNLASLFGPDEKIVVWDDGGAEQLEEQRKAWEGLAYAPEEDDDDDDDDDEGDSEEDVDEEEEDEEANGSPSSGKRRRSSPSTKRKRRKVDDDPNRLTRDERELHSAVIEKYYMAGTFYGQAASSTIYILATVLTRTDNDLLWFAILGLTYQYTTSRISRNTYDRYHAIYENEVRRLNKDIVEGGRNGNVSINARGPDDNSIRVTEELRFMLWRHWNLYDAMMHSGYVASKLGIWREKGRKRLHGLLAKMGFSTIQSQQPYSHMDMSLKKDLHAKLESITPEYGMVELSYASFARCCGYRSQPLSAADSIEAVSALLDAAGGVHLEIEIEGARNGGEWFGGGRVWQAHGQQNRWRDDEQENIPPGGQPAARKPDAEEGEEEDAKKQVQWWVRNFWSAFDSLNDITQLRDALRLSMSLHRAVIRAGSALIDKRAIRTMRGHRVVLLTQGPDLPLFASPGALARLARWLVDAMRERVSGTNVSSQTKKKSLPFVVAALDEREGTYLVVGINAALEFGDVRKNEFGLAFLDAKERCNARTRHGTFDSNVLEIKKEDLELFLQTLCEGVRR
ncbi:CDC45-like protein [Phellopilus nigrolimitatus]|nr:CDC45-like protein [Phellopilus nigrolimitatus]